MAPKAKSSIAWLASSSQIDRMVAAQLKSSTKQSGINIVISKNTALIGKKVKR